MAFGSARSRYFPPNRKSSKYAGTCSTLLAQATSAACFARGDVYATFSTSCARSSAHVAFSTV